MVRASESQRMLPLIISRVVINWRSVAGREFTVAKKHFICLLFNKFVCCLIEIPYKDLVFNRYKKQEGLQHKF